MESVGKGVKWVVACQWDDGHVPIGPLRDVCVSLHAYGWMMARTVWYHELLILMIEWCHDVS